MKHFSKFLIFITLFILISINCNVLLSTYVRFENNSTTTKTVNAIWDGINAVTLVPGQISEYIIENPGMHTLKWKNAATGKDLTSLGYPSLVQGQYYTFTYTGN